MSRSSPQLHKLDQCSEACANVIWRTSSHAKHPTRQPMLALADPSSHQRLSPLLLAAARLGSIPGCTHGTANGIVQCTFRGLHRLSSSRSLCLWPCIRPCLTTVRYGGSGQRSWAPIPQQLRAGPASLAAHQITSIVTVSPFLDASPAYAFTADQLLLLLLPQPAGLTVCTCFQTRPPPSAAACM